MSQSIEDKLTKLRQDYQSCTNPHLKTIIKARGLLLKRALEKKYIPLAKEANKIGGQFTDNPEYLANVKKIFEV